MGRSVNYLSNAHTVCFEDVSMIDDEFGWGMFKSDLVETFNDKYKSMEECDRWDCNETSIIVENQLIEVGISEYCGLASVSMRVKDFDGYDDYSGLAERFANHVGVWMEENIGDYVKLGTFSNGEAVYEKKRR